MAGRALVFALLLCTAEAGCLVSDLKYDPHSIPVHALPLYKIDGTTRLLNLNPDEYNDNTRQTPLAWQAALHVGMLNASNLLDFERAIEYRDAITQLDTTKCQNQNATIIQDASCQFVRDGHQCNSAKCTNDVWVPAEVSCTKIPDTDADSVPPFRGEAIALVVTPALLITIVLIVLRVRESRSAETV